MAEPLSLPSPPVMDFTFPVALVPAAAQLTGPVTLPSTYQAVVRTDTQAVLGIHGPGYRLLRNGDAFAAFDEAVQRNPLDRAGMQVRDELSHGGARAYRTYTFPGHGVAIGRANDLTHLQLLDLRLELPGNRRWGIEIKRGLAKAQAEVGVEPQSEESICYHSQECPTHLRMAVDAHPAGVVWTAKG